MNWIGHSVLAVVLAILAISGYVYFMHPTVDAEFFKNALLFLGVVAVSAIVPDIDFPDSKINWLIEIVVAATLAYLFVNQFGLTQTATIYAVGAWIIFKLIFAIIVPRHRGIVHSWIALAVYVVAVYTWSSGNLVVGAGAGFGFAAHLLLDGCGTKLF